MEDAIRDLVTISRYAAKHPDFVQGGGGNCSVKASGKMLIKASGFRLEDVSDHQGFVTVDLKSQTPEGGLRPSMEAPLHAVLGPCVIHTHPVLAGALLCSREGGSHFRELFALPNCVWIDYAQPGKILFAKVRDTLLPGPGSRKQVLFLQNHGLFVSAPDATSAIRLHEDTLARLLDFFGDPETAPVATVRPDAYLTPDHAVYAHSKEREELDLFTQKVAGLITRKGWHLKYLEPEAVRSLLEMEEEKYRIRITKPPS